MTAFQSGAFQSTGFQSDAPAEVAFQTGAFQFVAFQTGEAVRSVGGGSRKPRKRRYAYLPPHPLDPPKIEPEPEEQAEAEETEQAQPAKAQIRAEQPKQPEWDDEEDIELLLLAA